MPETPARMARRTKDWSNDANAAPGGRLVTCIASANSMPWAVRASAAATAGSSSARTFSRPSNFMNASRMALSSNPYRLRSTQPVSSSTVFAIQIGPAANRRRAAASCPGLSPVSNRTRTLVSTAVMSPVHLASNGSAHLGGRFRLAAGAQTARDLVEAGGGETPGWTEENPVASLLDRELRARSPGARNPYRRGQDDLTLGGKPG